MNSKQFRKASRIGIEYMADFIVMIGTALMIGSSGAQVEQPFAIMNMGTTGAPIVSQNDNELWNAEVWYEYRLDPSRGSCTIYEDFSLAGDCATWERDPDDDAVVNGIYNDKTYYPVPARYYQ